MKSIKCPICGKGKFIDVCNSSGKNSVACCKCNRFIVIDWDKMTAKPGETIKKE